MQHRFGSGAEDVVDSQADHSKGWQTRVAHHEIVRCVQPTANHLSIICQLSANHPTHLLRHAPPLLCIQHHQPLGLSRLCRTHCVRLCEQLIERVIE